MLDIESQQTPTLIAYEREYEIIDSNRTSRRWLVIGLPLAICLPCALPTVIAAVAAVGGLGAVSSFVGGAEGLLILLGGLCVVGTITGFYLAPRLLRRN